MPKLAVGDGVYFDYFRRQVVNNVAGLHTTNIWSRLVAGEGLEDDCIHHSVLAIGAFMRSTAQASNEQHHQVALQHHITAVTSFRQRIQFMAASSPAAVVMTTLLLAVFELLQGKLDAASSMVNSAIALLGDFSTPAQGEGAVVARRLSSRELHDIDWVLPSISVMDRLSHVARQPRCGMHLSQIEAEFRPPRPGRDSVSELFTRWGRFFTTSILFLQQSTFCGPKAVSEQELLESRPQQEALLSRLQKWKAVLVEYACSPHIDTTSQNALRLARVHWMLLYITVSCCLDPTHVIYDSFEDEFLVLSLECVDLVRDGWSHNPPTSVLLGEGLILPLSTVVRLCRNHDIRMKAAEALASLPSSIVAWDIQNLLDGLLGVVFLEELGRNDAGFVPPESRWCYFEDEQSTLGGNQDKVFQNLISDETNAPIRKTLSPDLDLRAEICKVAGCTKDHSDFDEG
ncbi:hypothetical protein GQ53DRAFT_742471 [Thozetella sp. PMI_491]|nr:hypothetical protein GQ53DRAFT_742471 [Thozetella sp. PMI_491]